MVIQEKHGPFAIRIARPDELPLLQEIEEEAGKLFSGLGVIDERLDSPFPADELARLIDSGLAWVGGTFGSTPVGMVISSIRDAAVYIEEMGVFPLYGRRGLGTALPTYVCNWAAERRHTHVALSTFADVRWNGPFYRKNGFLEMKPDDWEPWMWSIRDDEQRRGLDIDKRVFMQKQVGWVSPIEWRRN